MEDVLTCLCLFAVAVKGMPSEEQFSVCLRKIKMAFNLLVRQILSDSFYMIYYIVELTSIY